MTQQRQGGTRGRRGIWTVGITCLIAALLPEVVGADVYTGVSVHGIRWFSDVAPVDGSAYRSLSVAVPPVPEAAEGKKIDQEQVALSPVKTHQKKRRQGKKSSGGSPPAALSRPRQVTHNKRDRFGHASAKSEKAQQKRCRNYEAALRKIRAQRRAGYTAAQDRKLRERRQSLQEKQFAECS